jgi:single-strand DNA-binding protein
MFCKNRITLIGFIGKDAQSRIAATGTACTRFSIATNASWKEKSSGEYQTRTEWHSCVVWARLGAWAASLKKGALVDVEGELRCRGFLPADSSVKVRAARFMSPPSSRWTGRKKPILTIPRQPTPPATKILPSEDKPRGVRELRGHPSLFLGPAETTDGQKEILCLERDKIHSGLRSPSRILAAAALPHKVNTLDVGALTGRFRPCSEPRPSGRIACSPKFLQYPIGYSLHQCGSPSSFKSLSETAFHL